MPRRLVVLAALCLCAALPATAPAKPPAFTPGAPGLGDEYFPLDGNGGYDVRHYDLDLAYDEPSDRLTGRAAIDAKATQNLSRFNLDLDGLTVRWITVDKRLARWSRAGGELTITPAKPLRKGERFTVRIAYDGVPETQPDVSGFLHTDDGALAVGQPHGASTWFPVNDYLTDKASYTISITTPKGIEAISNGKLVRRSEPPRPHHVDVGRARADGLLPRDARDRRLRRPRVPRGRHLVLGRGRPAPARARRPADRHPVRVLPVRRPRLQAPAADDQRARLRRRPDVLGDARHRADLGLLLRRGAPPGPGRLDHAGRRERAQLAFDGQRLPVLARAAPVPRALPDRHRRGVRPRGHVRRVARGERAERRRTSSGRSTWTTTRARRSSSR